MLHGAQLAIEEANARGAYGGKPFKLMVHNDQAIWGASSNEMVKLAYDDKVWAMLGSISGDSTTSRCASSLKAEVPIVEQRRHRSTDSETIIPWYLTTIQDDRVQGYTLARENLQRCRLEEDRACCASTIATAVLASSSSRTPRAGWDIRCSSNRNTMAADTDFRRALRIINESGADGIVLWGDAAPAGTS